jgi:hypothetical protein
MSHRCPASGSAAQSEHAPDDGADVLGGLDRGGGVADGAPRLIEGRTEHQVVRALLVLWTGAHAQTVPVPGAPVISVNSPSVERMLAQRGATIACPSCGENAWLTLPAGWTLEIPVSDSAGVLPDVLALACRQCGFLRLHVDPATAFDVSLRRADD